MFDELMEMQDILNDVIKRTNSFQKATVLAGFMMMLEEWCKANHEDMVETFEMLNETCKAVNAEFGAY